jgi:hypothetical protein
MTVIGTGLVPGSAYRPTRSLEVSHLLDVPTLHTIGMLRRAKLPIRLRMVMPMSRYAGRLTGGIKGGRQQRIGDRVEVTEATVQAVQRLWHALSGQSAHVDRLGLLEKFRDVACRHRVVFQARFQSFKPESRQHQQPRYECHEQPRHKP